MYGFVRKTVLRSCVLVLAVTSLATLREAFAQATPTSRRFSFQGVVTDLPNGEYPVVVTVSNGDIPYTSPSTLVTFTNGVFSVMLENLPIGAFEASSGDGNAITVRLDVTTNNGLETFANVPLSAVPVAFMAARATEARTATIARNAASVGGVTVTPPADLNAIANGSFVRFNSSTKKLEITSGDSATNVYAGTGIEVTPSAGNFTVGVDTSIVPLLSSGKLNVSVLPTGTSGGAGDANKIPLLDGNGKVTTAMLPFAFGVGANQAVKLDGSAKLNLSMIPVLTGTEIGSDVIQTAHIFDGSITAPKIAASGLTANKYLKYDGSNMVWDTPAGGGGGLDPAGDAMTGDLTMSNQTKIRFGESSGNGTNYLALRAPANLTTDLLWTLPDTNGSDQQVMKFNATTNSLYWANDVSGGGGIAGPGTSTVGSLPRWNNGTGTDLVDSGVLLNGANDMTGINYLVASGVTTNTLNVASATPARVVITNATKDLVTSSVTDIELGYLTGVTAFASKVNAFTPTEATYLSGVTAFALKVNAFSPAHATYLSSVTSAIGPKLNVITSAEASYISGLNSPVQTQLNTMSSSKLTVAGGTMTGGLGLAYGGVTPDNIVIVDANRKLQTVNGLTVGTLLVRNGSGSLEVVPKGQIGYVLASVTVAGGGGEMESPTGLKWIDPDHVGSHQGQNGGSDPSYMYQNNQRILNGNTFMTSSSSSSIIGITATGSSPLLMAFAVGFDAQNSVTSLVVGVSSNVGTVVTMGSPEANKLVYIYAEYNGSLTYGKTTKFPMFQNSAPMSPATNDVWFDESANRMKVFDGSSWIITPRVYLGWAYVNASYYVQRHGYLNGRENYWTDKHGSSSLVAAASGSMNSSDVIGDCDFSATQCAYYWSVPWGVWNAEYEAWGAGGGGGGGCYNGSIRGGGGGGTGTYGRGHVSVVPGSIVRFLVGKGGAGASTGSCPASPGVPGGDSTATLLAGSVTVAAGGGGGNGATSALTGTSGSGASRSSLTPSTTGFEVWIRRNGAQGMPGVVGNGGDGGSAPFTGEGGLGTGTNGETGGGGAGGTDTTAAGSGGQGLVVIKY